jgi:large subunit ribosomal protein L13
MQKSYRAPNPGENRTWFLVDAKDQSLGRLAVVVANKLRAKDLPTFDPSVDAGAFVIVTNAASVKLTGKKEEQKDYQRYSGYRNGLKHFTAAEMRASHPDRMIKEAVERDARETAKGKK